MHWGALAYAADPSHALVSAFSDAGGATGVPWLASQGFHNVTMTLVSFTFMVSTLRINVLFALVFLGLVFLFAFTAAADFKTPTATTPEEMEHVTKLIHIGGGFGMLGVVCGWYLALITACEATGIPCPLPVFDLSTHIFPKKTGEQLKVEGEIEG